MDDPTPEEMGGYAIIQDDSIWVNKEKMLLTLGRPVDFLNRPVSHANARILDKRVGKSLSCDEVKQRGTMQRQGRDNSRVCNHRQRLHLGQRAMQHRDNPLHRFKPHHRNMLQKSVRQARRLQGTVRRCGQVHLQFKLTDSAYLLPPNLRAIARFMNRSQCVRCGIDMTRCHRIPLSNKEREEYAIIMGYKPLLEELHAVITVADYMENLLKKEGFCGRTAVLCERRIILGLFGTANNWLAVLGVHRLDYIMEHRAKLPDKATIVNIFSDIIESSFVIFKAKKSPNKLYGVAPLVLMITLYPKVVNKSVTKNIDFKELLANVKLEDVDAGFK